MSILQDIMTYKQLERERANADINAISGALQTFQAARQQSALMDLERQKLDASLAKSGLKKDERGKISRDESLLTTEETLPKFMNVSGNLLQVDPITGAVNVRFSAPEEGINPQIKVVDGNVIRVNPETGGVDTLYESKQKDQTVSLIDEEGNLKIVDVPEDSKVMKIDKDKAEREQRKMASTLRKEFNTAQVKKNYETINRSVKAMEKVEGLISKGDEKSLIAADQALVVLFNKILDPTSVVRESEFARTPQGAGFINRIKAIAPQLEKGGLRLTNQERKALVRTSQKLLVSSLDDVRSLVSRYQNLSELNKVNPDLVFGGLDKEIMKPTKLEALEALQDRRRQKNGK